MNKNLVLSCICACLLISRFLFLFSGCRVDDTSKCEGPTPHTPDWTQSKYTNIHVGDSVKFTYSGEDVLNEEMGVYWEFENGIPSWEDQPVVWVTFTTPGCWKVRLEMRPRCQDKENPFKEMAPAVCVVE
jgi:hypothetical protein